MSIFHENLATFEQKKMFKNREYIVLNLIKTVTSEAKVLIPKVWSVQGHSPGGGCGAPHQFFFRSFWQIDKFMDNIFF